MTTPPLSARLEKLVHEHAEVAVKEFDDINGEAYDAYCFGFKAAAALYQEEMARLSVELGEWQSADQLKQIETLKHRVETMREALSWIANNAGHSTLCEGAALTYCDAGCEFRIKARNAMGIK